MLFQGIGGWHGNSSCRLGPQMNQIAMGRRRRLTARVAHVTGDIAWWVFVVGRLMSELAFPSFGMPRRYADYDESLFGTGLGNADDEGWSAYVPLTDQPPSMLTDTLVNANVVAASATGALAVTLIAATTEAVARGRWRTGVGTVVAPLVGAFVILFALYERDGILGGGRLDLPLVGVFVLVLLGVAVREVWSRVLVRACRSTGL